MNSWHFGARTDLSVLRWKHATHSRFNRSSVQLVVFSVVLTLMSCCRELALVYVNYCSDKTGFLICHFAREVGELINDIKWGFTVLLLMSVPSHGCAFTCRQIKTVGRRLFSAGLTKPWKHRHLFLNSVLWAFPGTWFFTKLTTWRWLKTGKST